MSSLLCSRTIGLALVAIAGCNFDTSGDGGPPADSLGSETEGTTGDVINTSGISETLTEGTTVTSSGSVGESDTTDTNATLTSGPPGSVSHEVTLLDVDDYDVGPTQLLLDLAEADVRWNDVDSNFDNFRIFDPRDDSNLPFQIDSRDGDAALLWVRVPGVSAAFADFRFEYGPGITGGPAADEDVWEGLQGVWHLNEDPTSGQFQDHSGNGRHLEGAGLVPGDGADGTFGAALSFDTDKELSRESWGGATIEDAITIEAWMLITEFPNDAYRMFVHKPNNYDFTALRNEAVADTSWNLPQFLVYADDGSKTPVTNGLYGDVSFPRDVWSYVVVTFERTAPDAAEFSRISYYVDGVFLESRDFETFTANVTSDAFFVGSHFPGALDEVRIAQHARSADWVAVQHRSGTRDLLDIGAAQPAG